MRRKRYQRDAHCWQARLRNPVVPVRPPLKIHKSDGQLLPAPVKSYTRCLGAAVLTGIAYTITLPLLPLVFLMGAGLISECTSIFRMLLSCLRDIRRTVSVDTCCTTELLSLLASLRLFLSSISFFFACFSSIRAWIRAFSFCLICFCIAFSAIFSSHFLRIILFCGTIMLLFRLASNFQLLPETGTPAMGVTPSMLYFSPDSLSPG
mmetsp:Transcript_22198/g.54697  ORF Transcript_22198/g.54697 Transcript_22198/m.54697 type:complete len:207 (+) Transcript_22198:81-701(+)|eukprot:CAMPEP_0206246052 /NCGR_PEP_ID=MMETSP0047_2-20121206/19038_1 /ASSEMBLY_ACC=CAM_ASM_000192 /TAXON_ID=195065 /ORGANISM="Chroomonas mesostigmatica_cf, Strain CCMP1168" /LENGTH=206 /DNA_ID=CAMNT_0053671419 /DNA_START=67 /DNA_END=687 /DNA_ORIENTATION=-